MDSYVACFCADADSLAHWQVYGHRGSGYDLIFDANALRHRSLATLYRVEYRIAQQRRCVNHLIDESYRRLELNARDAKNDDELGHFFTEWTSAVAFVLAGIVALFKDPRFQPENEWRLLLTVPAGTPSPDVRFRSASTSIIPFVELRLAEPNDEPPHPPLSKITFIDEPGLQTKRMALEMLLRHRGMSWVQVERSSLPLRAR